VRPLRAAARLAAPPWGRVAAGAAVAAALAGAVGTGKQDAPPAPPASALPASARAPVPPQAKPRRRVALIGGKALQSARCAQWERGNAHQREAIVTTLQAVVGGPTPYGQASALAPGDATALFDRACSRFYARSFLLYELYTRASAFGGARPRY